MSKFGGGGTKCTICDKTSYPAETVTFEKKPYHFDCFRCSECNKKFNNASEANMFEDVLYCKQHFASGGFAQKQRQVKWTKSDSASTTTSKFGGGGTKCVICEKTVYMAEQVLFEKKVYHSDCFKCTLCEKKITPSGASMFDSDIICSKCFKDNGYAQKQTKVGPKTGSSTSNSLASKFGGGGVKCVRCDKTVYVAEQVSFEKVIYHQECFTCCNPDCGKKLSTANAEYDKETESLRCKQCHVAWVHGGKKPMPATEEATATAE
jgi:cysteine/glycine-rich protein